MKNNTQTQRAPEVSPTLAGLFTITEDHLATIESYVVGIFEQLTGNSAPANSDSPSGPSLVGRALSINERLSNIVNGLQAVNGVL